MRVLLTGGSGMVGHAIIANKPDWADLVTPSSSELDLLSWQSTWAGMGWRFADVDLVIHAAGKVGGIAANISDPYNFCMDNLTMGRNLVKACQEFKIPRLLNIGSSCMYPRDISVPITEEMLGTGPLEPTNEGYAIAKLAVSKLCYFYGPLFKTVIPCNLFGEYDKFDPLNAHLIPSVISKIYTAVMSGELSVEIWGNGTARREFMYSGEFAKLLWKSVEKFDNLPPYLNIGSGIDTSVLGYYQIINIIMSNKLKKEKLGFRTMTSKPTGMQRKLLDVSKMDSLGIETASEFRTGLMKTIDWFLNNKTGGQ